MENKSFDDILKAKLDDFQMKADINAWEAFETFRENDAFDQVTKAELETFQFETIPNDWNILDEKLMEVEMLSDFDTLIEDKLTEAALDETPDWERFEKILYPDQQFDEEVSSKVKNHEIASHENQWPKLSAHLEEIERRKKRIVITKLIEAAVFILFIITLMQLYPIQNITKSTLYRTVGVQNDLNKKPKDRLSNENLMVLPSPNEWVIKEESIINNELAFAEAKINSIISLQDFDEQSADLSNQPQLHIEKIPSSLFFIEEIALEEELQLFDEEIDFRDAEVIPVKPREMFYKNAIALVSKNIPFIAYKNSKSLQKPQLAIQQEQAGQYWLNLYSSPDLNFINTPYDHDYNVSAYQSQATGYSVGASLSYENNDLEIEGGLSYTSLNYHPKQITELTGSLVEGFKETTLKEIIFDIVQIPFNFKYNLLDKKGWSIYANSGLSAGFIFSAGYDIDEEYYFPLASSRPGNVSLNSNNEIEKYNPSILDGKEFDEGIMNKGNIAKNTFFTLNTGVGVSKKINDVASFYVQPSYHYNLNIAGLGPNNDLVHRLGLQIGTKVKI